jgi:hypothetical protein
MAEMPIVFICFPPLKSTYIITPVLKVETNIIASIVACPVWRVMMLLIMYVEIFKTDLILLLSVLNVTMWRHTDCYFSVPVCALILTISHSEIKGKIPYLPINSLIKDEVLITVGCPIFLSILIAKYLFTGSLKNRSIDNLDTQKKYISMKNSQFFNYLLYVKSK